MTESKPKRKRLKGLAANLQKRTEGVNESEEFKKLTKNVTVKLLLNPTDARHAALVTIDKGTLTLESMLNKDEEALKKKVLGWNGKMATDLRTFLDYGAGAIGLGKLFIKILTGKVKVRGLLFFVLLEKCFSMAQAIAEPPEEPPKPIVDVNQKKNLIVARLFLLSGYLHLIVGILAFGVWKITAIAFMMAFFVCWLSSMLAKLIKGNVMAERPPLIFSTIITFLSSLTYLLFMIMGDTMESEIGAILNVFMIIIICINVICFITFYNSKTKIEIMDFPEKLSYFSIVIIRGIGMSMFFHTVTCFSPFNGTMALYLSIFGILLMIFGEKLLTESGNIKIQKISLLILFLAVVVGFIVFLISPLRVPPLPLDWKTFTYIVIVILVIPIRVYYINEIFEFE